MIERRHMLGLAAAAALGPVAARAEWVPSRSATMVVPYPPGGPTDLIARLLAQEISGSLGQPMVIENLPGGAGSIGTRRVAQAPADGLTLVFGTNQTHATNISLIPQGGGYDPVKDFTAIAGVADLQHILVVRNELPAANVAEFLALVRQDPGKITCGSTGQGSASHLALELFKTRTGTEMVHVPYRGSAPLLQDMMGGHVDASFATTPTILTQVQAGRLRALAVASPNPSPHLPQLPTLAAAGVPGVEADAWLALFAPTNIPAPALERYRAIVAEVLARPAVKARIADLGMAANAKTGPAMDAFLVEDVRRWAEVIRAANVRVE